MKCVVVDMRNRLFGDAISGSLQHFDSGFRVYQTEGTAAEDLCVDTHADVLVAEVTAYPPWRLEQRLDLCRRLRQGLPGCQVALVVDEVCEPQLADQVRQEVLRQTGVELELDQAVETVADLDKFIQSKKG